MKIVAVGFRLVHYFLESVLKLGYAEIIKKKVFEYILVPYIIFKKFARNSEIK